MTRTCPPRISIGRFREIRLPGASKYWWKQALIGYGFLVVFSSSLVRGQALKLSSTSGSPGDRVTIEFSLESVRGREPVGLQWETRIPDGWLAPDGEGMMIGPAAQRAGKELKCTTASKDDKGFRFLCLLSGGQKRIPNGAVALLKLRIPSNPPRGSETVRAEQIIAVSGDLKSVSVAAAISNIYVRYK